MSTQIAATRNSTAGPRLLRASIIIPTLNEAGSIAAAVDRLAVALDTDDCDSCEIIIVDDNSPDGTGAIADAIAERYHGRVLVIHHRGRRSLGESVVEAWALAAGNILVLMDADLQHPPEVIPRLIREVEAGADIVVGSRYVAGGTMGEFSRWRQWLSATATRAVRLSGGTVAQVRDPLSGCFAMRREVIVGREVRPAGFKVLLEVLRAGKYERVREIGLSFGRRHAGSSEMRAAMVTEDARLLLRMAWEDARVQASQVPASVTVLLAALVALLLLVTGIRLWTGWHTDALLDHVSGIWLASADDLRHGLVYRPPQGDLGYGGTRYFPLFIGLLAASWRWAGDWRVAAYGLSLGSVLLLMGGVYAVLRACGASRQISACGAAAVLAGITTQEALLSIRADSLAAALNLWGVALSMTHPTLPNRERHRWRVPGAAAAFALAFATKMTTLFGAAAVVVALGLSGRRRKAAQLAALTTIGCILVVGITVLVGGRAFLDSFRLAASAGATPAFFVRSPLRLADMLRPCAAEGLFFVAALVCWLASKQRFHSVPGVLFLTTLAATLVILGSPGTNRNHLVDLYAASIIGALGWLVANPRRIALGMIVFAVVLGIGANAVFVAHRYQDGTDNRTLRTRAVLSLSGVAAPVLAENPLFPLLAGQRPYLLDPFMLCVIDARQPHWGDRLRRDLAERKFGAVVLEHDPHSDPQHWFERTHFGPWFVPLLDANYEVVARPGYIVVYKPRQ